MKLILVMLGVFLWVLAINWVLSFESMQWARTLLRVLIWAPAVIAAAGFVVGAFVGPHKKKKAS
jgi:hypothetical protein